MPAMTRREMVSLFFCSVAPGSALAAIARAVSLRDGWTGVIVLLEALLCTHARFDRDRGWVAAAVPLFPNDVVLAILGERESARVMAGIVLPFTPAVEGREDDEVALAAAADVISLSVGISFDGLNGTSWPASYFKRARLRISSAAAKVSLTDLRLTGLGAV